jgi:amidase
MLRQLTFAAFLLLTPSLASGQTAKFQIEEATIEDIQAAILRRELTSTGVVQLYLSRIKAYNGTCVNQPDGVLGAGPITPIKNAHQLNALMTLNLRPEKREKLGFDSRKARSMTDARDDDPAMPDALEVAAQQDAHFASTGRLIGPLHGVVLSIKDQYDTFDMRTTAGMDAAYANDRPPRDATFVKRLREAVRSSWPRPTWERWERQIRAAPSAGRSVTLTIRNAVPAPPAAAPDRRLPQTW